MLSELPDADIDYVDVYVYVGMDGAPQCKDARARALQEVRSLALRDDGDRLTWERGCVERSLRGDRRAFGEIYAAFAPALYAEVLLPRLGNAPAAEEALAETFSAALEKLAAWRPQGGSLFGWLARIAVNKAVDLHRARARAGKALAGFEALVAPLRERAPDEAERRLDLPRLAAAVDAALSDLTPRYRRALELRILQELSRPECARLLEVTVGNFDVLLLRALRSFRAAWVARHGEEEEP
jgi:RNA polymerase sigma-70 factor (ECF subfamily)